MTWLLFHGKKTCVGLLSHPVPSYPWDSHGNKISMDNPAQLLLAITRFSFKAVTFSPLSISLAFTSQYLCVISSVLLNVISY